MFDKQLIFVAGLGSTGSSAICDILEEHSGFYVPKEEWRIWVDPYCLIDLARKLENPSSIFTLTTAISDFERTIDAISGKSLGRYATLRLGKDLAGCISSIKTEVLNLVVDKCYSGLWYGNMNLVRAKLNFVFSRLFWKSSAINKNMWLCKTIETTSSSYRLFGKVVEKSLESLAKDKNLSTVAINENFSILFSDEIFRMHPESRIIVAIRNPLDVYSDSKRVGWLAMPYEIDAFILWQNQMLNQLIAAKKKFPSKILVVAFEDLVSDYDQTLTQIQKFLGLNADVQHSKRTFFIPEVSSKNIDQWMKKDLWLRDYKDRFNFYQYRARGLI